MPEAFRAVLAAAVRPLLCGDHDFIYHDSLTLLIELQAKCRCSTCQGSSRGAKFDRHHFHNPGAWRFQGASRQKHPPNDGRAADCPHHTAFSEFEAGGPDLCVN